MSGSDGLGSLTIAILAVCLAMITGGGLLFYLLARKLKERAGIGPSWGLNRRGRIVVTALLTLIGLAIGYSFAIGAFREDLLAPSPQIRLFPPPGYRDVRIIVLEDLERGQPLRWRRGGAFAARRTDVQVPASGVVRIRELRPEEEGRADVDIVWGDDGEGSMNGGGQGPPGTGARSYYIVERLDAWANGAPPPLPEDPAALGAYVLAREVGRPGDSLGR